MQDYLGRHFAGGRAACGVFSKGGKLTVVISGDKINLKNYWSASWVSTWTVEGGEISGTAKIRAHYFEEGNVQLHTTKDFPKLPVSGEGEEFGKSVAARIFEGENALHLALGSMYVNMSEETLKVSWGGGGAEGEASAKGEAGAKGGAGAKGEASEPNASPARAPVPVLPPPPTPSPDHAPGHAHHQDQDGVEQRGALARQGPQDQGGRGVKLFGGA